MDIGTGISEGVSNFFRMYYLTRDRKRQEKLESIQPVLDAIHAQLKDNTIPLDKKKELINQIENVYNGAGVKIKLPNGQKLADMILPGQWLDEYIDTGEEVNDEAVNAVPEGISQTDNITTTPIKFNLQKRRGDLSQADIELGLQRKSERQKSEDEASIRTKQQKELALYQFNLQQDLIEQQYTKNPEEVVEPTTGRTWSVYTNPKGEAKFVPLGAYHNSRGELMTQPEEDTISVSTFNAREKAKGGAGGLGATFKALRFTVSRELGLPEDDERVLDETAKRWGEQYSARTYSLQQGGQYTSQGVTGTRQIQPSETERLSIEKEKLTRDDVKYISELEGEINSADETITNENIEISNREGRIAAANARMVKLLNDGYEESDEEVVKARKEVADLQKAQEISGDKIAAAKDRKTKARTKLDSYKRKYEKSNSSTIEDNTTYPGIVLRAIEIFRDKNKGTQFARWTDEQIVNYLRSKGILK